VGKPSSAKSFSLLIEKFQGMDLAKVGLILNHLTTSFASSKPIGVVLCEIAAIISTIR